MTSAKFNLRLAMCISLFSFANYVTQPLYSALVPVLLSKRLSSTVQVGAILSCCNFLAMLIHPLIGNISDRTRCRFGRRRPYILSGALICGTCFAVLPWLTTFRQFTIVLVCYSLSVAYWRAPISAIQIDCVRPEHIVRTNAIASCVLGLSSVFAYLSNNYLAVSGMDERLVFVIGGSAAILAAAIGCATVHEEDSRQMQLPEKKKGSNIIGAFLELSPERRKQFAGMLALIGFVFVGNSGFEYFFVLFTIESTKVTAGKATLYLASYMSAYFAGSLVCSCMKKNICAWKRAAKALAIAAVIQLLFFGICCRIPQKIPLLLWAVCMIYGACWGIMNIYIYPLWLEFNKAGHSGNLMGLYFVATGLAAAITPALYGAVHDMTGTYSSLFAFCGIAFLLAFIMLGINWKMQNGKQQNN